MTDASTFEALSKLFDPYNRVARLYPSGIAFLPILWSAVALFPSIVENVSRSAAFGIAAAGMLYFVTSLTRSLGKRAEPILMQRWGGWPSTLLLQHRNEIIDAITKDRYHRSLENIAGLTLPTAAEERQDPARADDLYRSATKKLIEQRRGPQYKMLHGENASYGFRRNLYGLKPLAIVESILLMLLTGFGWWLITPQPYTRLIIAQSVISYPYFPILLMLDFAYLLLWVWAVRPDFVFQAGREYGEALLRTLD